MNSRTVRALAAEALGSFLLFATVVGSGIMAEHLASGNLAIALLGNTIATGAMLFVLITMLGPISGAHFNPAVSLVMWLRKELTLSLLLMYIMVQLVAGIAGVWAAHIMFEMPVIQFSEKARNGAGQWAGELIATFGLLITILGTLRHRRDAVAASVALYITSAYWFTSSTSFANPAITVARSLSNSFAGIAPGDVAGFIAAQLVGAVGAWAIGGYIFDTKASGPGPADNCSD